MFVALHVLSALAKVDLADGEAYLEQKISLTTNVQKTKRDGIMKSEGSTTTSSLGASSMGGGRKRSSRKIRFTDEQQQQQQIATTAQ